MCRRVFRPFYGWIPFFYKETLFGTFHALYEHGSEWCLVFSMLLAVANLPLDVYVAYLYFFDKFYFFYQPETNVQRSFAALALVSFFILIAFIWCTGKGLLTIADKNKRKIAPEKKLENDIHQVVLEDEKDEKVQEVIESSKGDDQSNLSQSTTLQDAVPSSKVSSNSTNSESLETFNHFNFFCYAVYLTAAGPGQLYLLYFYIVRCIVEEDLFITTKLILAGYLLPFFLCCLVFKDIYKVMSRTWKRCCTTPILLTVASLTILSGMAAAWLATLSLHATITITGDEASRNSLADKNGINNPALILHSEDRSFHLTYASEVLAESSSIVNIQYDCLKNFDSRMKSECTKVDFYFNYSSSKKEIVFDFNVKSLNNVSSTNTRIQQWIGWSCDLCGSSNKLRHDRANNNDNSIIDITSDNKKVKNCDQTPEWLFYTLTACSFFIIIAYIVLLTQAVLVRGKNKVWAAEEEEGIRFTRSLSIVDRKLHQIKEDTAEETTTKVPVKPSKKRSQTSFKDVVEAVSMHSVTTGSAINPKMDMGMAAMLAYKRPRIIRVPKGTTRSMGKIDKK